MDTPPVVKRRETHPAINTAEYAKAMGISYADALRLKWDLDAPNETAISPGISFAKERAEARSAAIQEILSRFENGQKDEAFDRTNKIAR